MVLSMEIQIRIVVFSILAGILTGIMFDLYRMMRGLNTIKVIRAVEDILFWNLVAITIFIFLLYTNYAFVGVYVYLLIALGVFIYLKCFGRAFRKVCYKFFSTLFRGLRIGFKRISYPVKVMFYSGDYKKAGNDKK